ncbi:MAG: methyltransferase domain-containing protein, partial [Pseudomonadales bacterium]|nr:methyltransferase domain-containing protein [Pseudomonadales bacterium]
LQQQLKSEGINSRLGVLSQAALYLEDKPKQLTKLESFAEGLFSVQDEAPQLCAPLLDLQPGQRVLDACAAPGGKTGHILEAQQDLASLLAVDLEADRLQRVAENLARLQLSARLVAADIADLSAWYDGQPFDRILCDAPCSATGVIRRHPDIKLLRQAEDIDMLAQQQLQILLTLWQCLAPGGILLYATCSILPQENDAVIAGFIAQQPAVKVLPITLPNGLQTDYGWQLLPDHRAQDGFYYARLQKPC